ncbi:MAG: DUF2304 domain-containing protein [Armatimonadota bacterium]|nr:DUF2304 domain-containing protein [Armatimonadota bacterium]
MIGLAAAAIPWRQQASAAAASGLLLIIIIDLVRRRRLREEYAWLWLCIAAVVLLLSLRLQWLVVLTSLLGADVTASGAYFLGMFFLVCLSLHFSVKSSELAGQLKVLAQRTALLEAEWRGRE